MFLLQITFNYFLLSEQFKNRTNEPCYYFEIKKCICLIDIAGIDFIEQDHVEDAESEEEDVAQVCAKTCQRLRLDFPQEKPFSQAASFGRLLCSRKFSFVNFYFQEDEKVEKKAEALDHSVDLEGNLEDLGGVDSGANVEAERLARRVSVPDELENETEAFDPFGQETEPEVVVKRGRILEPKYVGKSEG